MQNFPTYSPWAGAASLSTEYWYLRQQWHSLWDLALHACSCAWISDK